MGKSVHIRIRNGRLYIETYMYGKQIRRSLGLTLTGDKSQDRKVMRLAEIIRSRREMQIVCAEWGIQDMLGSEKFLHIYMEENYQKCKNYTLLRCIHYVRTYRYGDVRLGQITPRWIEDFQYWLRTESGLSQGSASLYASSLRHQLRLAVRDRILTTSPAEFVKTIPMPESKKQPLSVGELKALAAIPIKGKLGSEVRRAFLFSCFTGLRVSDLRELRWEMLRTRSDGTCWLCKRQKKTGAMVSVPLHKNALAILAVSRRSEDGQVFPLLASTKTNTDQYLKKWGLQAGVEHVSWHTARHTMATLALEHGAELRTVSELLGHSGLSTTLRYAKATDPLKKAAISSLPPITPVTSGTSDSPEIHKN